MLEGEPPFVSSTERIEEYREVLLRPKFGFETTVVEMLPWWMLCAILYQGGNVIGRVPFVRFHPRTQSSYSRTSAFLMPNRANSSFVMSRKYDSTMRAMPLWATSR